MSVKSALDLWRDANINRAEGLEVTNRKTGEQSIVPHFDSSLRTGGTSSGGSSGGSSGVSSLGGSFHTA